MKSELETTNEGEAQGPLKASSMSHPTPMQEYRLDLVQSLLRLGLVDRLQLWVYPVVLGKGKRLFDSGTGPAALRLVDSAVFPNGRLKLDFATAAEPKFGNVGDPEEALRRLT